jgi:hypothetical protein
MEVGKSDMISCAIEWQPSEAAFDVWPEDSLREGKPGQATIFCPPQPDRMPHTVTDALVPDGVEC